MWTHLAGIVRTTVGRTARRLPGGRQTLVILHTVARPGTGSSNIRRCGVAATALAETSIVSSTSALASPSLPALSPHLVAAWNLEDLRDVLQQAARDGAVEKELLQLVRGITTDDAAEDENAVKDELDDGLEAPEREPCSREEFIRVVELCRAFNFRDFFLLAGVADRLTPLVPGATPELLLQVGTAFSAMGVLNTPLFQAIASVLLESWRAPSAEGAVAGSKHVPTSAQIVQAARAFSAQRMRHEELFDRFKQLLRLGGANSAVDEKRTAAGADASSLSPEEALSFLHSLAYLRLDEAFGDEVWASLENRAVEPGLRSLGVERLTELCYIIFLARRDGIRVADLPGMLEALAEVVPPTRDPYWTATGIDGIAHTAVHHRLLLLRSAMRYLHRDLYKSLPGTVSDMFRRVHRMDPPKRAPRPIVNFNKKLSWALTKLKVGHVVNAERGPFVLDVVERDRKLVYECNHFDRFYADTIEKIAPMCLQERIVKAMGYRVVQVPHWQWKRITVKRQRLEYLRMSRYYAIKDRREFAPREDASRDLQTDSLDYLGEYFFKKDAPSSAWSWFQPRYQADLRINTEKAPAP